MSFLDKVIGEKYRKLNCVKGICNPLEGGTAQMEQVLDEYRLNGARTPCPERRWLLKNRNGYDTWMIPSAIFYQACLRGPTSFASICDTGVGMSPEVRDRIFDLFFDERARQGFRDGAGPRSTESSGSTAISSRLQRARQGSLFHVSTFRLWSRPFAEVHASGNLFNGSKSKKSAGLRETILWPRITTRSAFDAAIADAAGLTRCSAAGDGSQACVLARTRASRPAVLDVVMPHMGGAATAAQLLPTHALDCQSSSPAAFPKNANNAWPGADPTICRSVRPTSLGKYKFGPG